MSSPPKSRLAAVKHADDQGHLFRFNQDIRPQPQDPAGPPSGNPHMPAAGRAVDRARGRSCRGRGRRGGEERALCLNRVLLGGLGT